MRWHDDRTRSTASRSIRRRSDTSAKGSSARNASSPNATGRSGRPTPAAESSISGPTDRSDWLSRTVPAGRKLVVEPFLPGAWAQDIGLPSRQTSTGDRWLKWPTSRSPLDPDTGKRVPGGAIVNVEDYVKTLRPELIDEYRRGQFCWVVVGSHQQGRALAEPDQVPGAIAYYERLEREARLAARFRPYDRNAKPVPFNFDWSFVYYPLRYARPGPEILIYRLRGAPCGPPVEVG